MFHAEAGRCATQYSTHAHEHPLDASPEDMQARINVARTRKSEQRNTSNQKTPSHLTASAILSRANISAREALNTIEKICRGIQRVQSCLSCKTNLDRRPDPLGAELASSRAGHKAARRGHAHALPQRICTAHIVRASCDTNHCRAVPILPRRLFEVQYRARS